MRWVSYTKELQIWRTKLLTLSVITLVSLFLLWIFFLAIMNLKGVRDTTGLPKEVLIPAKIALFIGWVLDFIVNLLLSFFFIDIPRETTVTARLKRYAYGKDGWRKKFTLWFSTRYLDPFDPRKKHV